MRVLATARDLMAADVWARACELADVGHRAVIEGQMSMDDEVELTMQQARELGLTEEV